MTSRDFAYWLQGFFEITDAGGKTEGLSSEQVNIIKRHLNLVFVHEIDPSYGNKQHQAELNLIHEGLCGIPKGTNGSLTGILPVVETAQVSGLVPSPPKVPSLSLYDRTDIDPGLIRC